jgi:hypothetical protein
LFRQIQKPRKITNPKEREEKEEEPSSSSSSSSSSPLQNLNFLPRESMSNFEKQFHPLITPINGSPLEAIIDMNIMKKGRIINTPLTASEAEFYAEQKDTFEVLLNKIPKDQYRAIQERARMNINNVFSDVEIARIDKWLPGDARGAALQRHAITLAREGMTALQCIDEGVATENVEMFNVARTYVKDIITMASAISNQGSIDRVYARNPELARIIKYKDEEQVLTPQMLQEIKEYKEANPARKFLYAAGKTGFGAYRHHFNNPFNPSFGRSNYNNRNFNNNNNNNSFFRTGGEDTYRHALSPQGTPSRIPEEIIEDRGGEEDLVEEPIKVPDGPADILDILPERGEIKEVFSALAVYWGLFIGLVWYYAEFYKQGESYGIFQTAQKIYGIQRKSKTPGDLRQKIPGSDKDGHGRGDNLAKTYMDKPFPPGSESERRYAFGDRHEKERSTNL